MATVGGGIEQHIFRPSLDAAFQRRLQRLVAGVVLVEGKIVAIKQHPARFTAQDAQQQRQCVDVLPVDLDQHQMLRLGPAAIDFFVHGLDQAGFAHAAGAPQKRVVGRQPLGEMAGVGQQDFALRLDAFQQAEIDMGDVRHGDEAPLCRLPHKGAAGRQFLRHRGRGHPFQCRGDAFQRRRVRQAADFIIL